MRLPVGDIVVIRVQQLQLQLQSLAYECLVWVCVLCTMLSMILTGGRVAVTLAVFYAIDGDLDSRHTCDTINLLNVDSGHVCRSYYQKKTPSGPRSTFAEKSAVFMLFVNVDLVIVQVAKKYRVCSIQHPTADQHWAKNRIYRQTPTYFFISSPTVNQS